MSNLSHRFDYPKKSLGQHFLVNKGVLRKIVESADIKSGDTVVEIGPGTGNLTENLIKKNPSKLIVVEKDDILSNNLNKKFSEKITIIKDDVLNIINDELKFKKIIVVGNLPYNISSQILVRWIRLKNLNKISKTLIFMFQK